MVDGLTYLRRVNEMPDRLNYRSDNQNVMDTEHTSAVQGESRVYKVGGKNAQKLTAYTAENKSCYNSGKSWPHLGGNSTCPARGKTCKKRNKRNHFANVCKSRL